MDSISLNSPAKFDIAVHNAHIISLDSKWNEYKDGLILVKGNTISYAGDAASSQAYSADKVIDAGGGLIIPNFFNGHAHSAMSLFRGMGTDLPLNNWINDHIWPAEARFINPESVFLGSMVSALEMIRCGTGIFADMYFFQDDTVRACEEIGIRIIVGEGVLDFPTPNKKNPSGGLKHTEYLFNKYQNHPLVTMSLPAHSPYTCSPGLISDIGSLSRDLGIPATIHLAETLWEDEEIKKRYGKSPTLYLADLGFFDGPSVAYHCNHLSEEDIEILKTFNVGVVTNPNSNMKLGSGVCPVPGLLKKGINIGIGTDGAASNNNQCILLDMQLMARLNKLIHMDPRIISAKQSIRMAISNNAEIYGLGKTLGSIEAGKAADFMIIDTDQAHWQPLFNPYAAIVYSMQPGDVTTTIVNGKIIMENRQILTVDEEYFIDKITRLGKKINKTI